MKFDYLDIPVLLQHEAKTDGGIRPPLYVGPSIRFKASCRIVGSTDGISVNTSYAETETDSAYAGIEFSLERWAAAIRYAWSAGRG